MVKITTSDVKKGSILLIDWKLFKVTETAHTHMWRWGANDTYKVKDRKASWQVHYIGKMKDCSNDIKSSHTYNAI